MESGQPSHLLNPELSDVSGQGGMYSLRSYWVMAILGGPVGVVCYSLCNMKVMGRLKCYLPLYGTIIVLAIVWATTIDYLAATQPPAWLTDSGSQNALQMMPLLNRLAGMLALGVVYLGQRQLFRASLVNGSIISKPWKALLLSFLVSALVYGAIFFGVRFFIR